MTTPLKYVADIISGQSPPSEEVSPLGEGLPFLQGNAEFGDHHPAAQQQCDTAPKRCEVGDVLISVRAPVGAVNVADRAYGIGRGLNAVRAEAVHPGYLRWFLESEATTLNAVATGSTYVAVTAEDVGALRLPVTDQATQARIAKYLDAEVRQLEELAAMKDRSAALLDERRAAVVASELFTSPAEPNRPDLQESGLPTVGPVPAHWKVLRNKDLFREVSDLSDTGDEELLTVSHLTGVTRRADKDVPMFLAESMVGYKRVTPGDLVINTMWAWMGALGVSSLHGIVSPAYGVYRSISSEVHPAYFDLLYRSSAYVCEMTRHSKGVWSSRLRLYPESFLALRVALPPRAEQERIVTRVAAVLAAEERLRPVLRESAGLLRERRQAVVRQAVRGELPHLLRRAS